MTQTTAVRVESILESHLHLIPLMVGVDGESADIGGMTEAARKIAAEIDALRDEMAVILRERNDAHLALAEARAEVAKLKEQNRVLATTSLRDVIKSVHPSGRARGQ